MYVALSGQMAMAERLETVANNVANMRTAGFRAETVQFDTVLSDYRRDRVAFASSGTQHMDRAAGPIEQTGNPLDLAVVGDAWFGVDTPAGRAYTRDGRFTVNPFGDLVTLTGYNVVDEGGAPIAADLEGGAIRVGADGRMTQDGNLVGVVGLFDIPQEATLTRYGDVALLSDVPGEPVADRTANGVRQGFREGSNVDAVRSIVELIEIQRAFDRSATAVRERSASLEEAVRLLGAE
jgi:flagellar basal-body rod protein FlgF